MNSYRPLWLVAVLVAATLATTACAGRLSNVIDWNPRPSAERDGFEDTSESLEAIIERAREAVAASPDLAQPTGSAGTAVWRTGLAARGLRIMVGTESRSLWLMRDTVVLFRAPIAVGKSNGFNYGGRAYDFRTPIGRRSVLAKATDPLWVPPDWHYFEHAVERNLKVVQLRRGQSVKMGDGTTLEIRGDDVGRVNQFGNFWPFTPGIELIFEGTIYIPPFGTNQRRIPAILGTHKLELGDGYLIHGTNEETSIGDAVSHGCVRMYNADVERLYQLVPVGTPVFIF